MDLFEQLKNNTYPGRGLVVGKNDDNKSVVIAYFIMGRSENSRNRVFIENAGGIKTKPFDDSKVTDPRLIIYSPVRVINQTTIISNGDQTDTIYDYLAQKREFQHALKSRTFEPDAPNYTPRISAIVRSFDYKMSLIKSAEGSPASTRRYYYEYINPISGQGHYLHTYMGDGTPLPSFMGEPVLVHLTGDIDTFTDKMWDSLNSDNKVSLFTRFIDIPTGKYETRIINKNV